MRRAAVAVAIAVALGGCGGDDQGSGLSWDGEPRVARHPELPGDMLVTARLRNESDRELRLEAADVRVLDPSGRSLRASSAFAAGYSHSLYPPRDAPAESPDAEEERLGRAVAIRPGAVVPVTLAWHASEGKAARVEFGDESLPLP